MSDIKEKAKQMAKLSVDAKKLYAEMEADEAKNTAENREKLEKMIADGENLRDEINQAKRLESIDEFVSEPEEKSKEDIPEPEKKKSWGETFIKSNEFQTAVKQGRKKTDSIEVKLLVSDVDAQGGILIYPQRRPGIVDRTQLPETTLLDILSVAETNSNAIPYVVMTGFTNNARGVKDYDETEENFGLKPFSDMTFASESAPVETIAHGVAIHRNLLADEPAVRGIIDTKLIIGLRRVLENQVLSGDGTSPNLKGIRSATGVQTRFKDSTRGDVADTKADQLRRAITDVKLAFGVPNAIVLNPVEAEALELLKDDNKNYTNIYDPVLQRIWRIRVVENQTFADDKYMVGDFAMGATLFMRENANIRMSENFEDFFMRNAVVLLAELRAALTVEQPEYFVDGTFTNEP